MTTIYTTFISVLNAFYLVWNVRPALIICNGPGNIYLSILWRGQLIHTLLWTDLKKTLFDFSNFYVLDDILFYMNTTGTCVPICFVAFLYKILGFLDADIVFVESFCRVQRLSLTGKLLYFIADKFIVQWTRLLTKHPRAEYLGDFIKSN